MSEPITGDGASPPVACSTCGQVHPRCAGHSRRSGGGPCGVWPINGSTVCGSHGARAPQVKRAAARRVEAQRAEAAVRSLGLRDDRDPDEVILDELAWTAGHVLWLRQRVQELEPDVLVWGVTSKVDKDSGEFPGVDTTSAAAPNAWVELYARERRHLLDVYKVIKGTRLEERRIELARAQVAPQIADVIGRFVEELGLSAEQVSRAPEALRRAVQGFLAGGHGRVLEGSVHSG